MNREDQTEAPNEEIAGAPTLDSDEASRALARVQQVRLGAIGGGRCRLREWGHGA